MKLKNLSAEAAYTWKKIDRKIIYEINTSQEHSRTPPFP